MPAAVDSATTSPVGASVSQVGERPPGEDDGQRQDHRAGPDRRAPAERGGHGRQGQRRGDAAQRESHLLDAHRDAALAHRKHVHDGAAERGIDHAPADAGHDQAAEKEGKAGRERGGEQPCRADREPTEQARAHADPVGEPAPGQREEQPADVDRREDEGELEAGEAKAVEQARRQRRESEHSERARSVRRGEDAQEQPSVRERGRGRRAAHRRVLSRHDARW